MKKLLFLILFVFAVCSILLTTANAHSGGTDSNGGHYDGDDYHYHHGYPAHDHYDMDGDGDIDCPYDFHDNVDHDRENAAEDTVHTPNATEVPNNSTSATKKTNAANIVIKIIGGAIMLLCIAPTAIGILMYVLAAIWDFLQHIWNFLRYIGSQIKNLISKKK